MATASMCDACKTAAPMQFGAAHPVGWVLVRIVPDFQAFQREHMMALAANQPPPETDKVFCGASCAITYLMANQGVTI